MTFVSLFPLVDLMRDVDLFPALCSIEPAHKYLFAFPYTQLCAQKYVAHQ